MYFVTLAFFGSILISLLIRKGLPHFVIEQKEIEDTLQKSVEGKWSYPKTFNRLKDLGISHYEVAVPRQQITYYSPTGSWAADPLFGPDLIPVNDVFNADGIKMAIRRSQQGLTTYPQFLSEIATAGCSHYRVDMASRTIAYMGDVGEKLVEDVPLL